MGYSYRRPPSKVNRDANHAAIVAVLRSVGCSVLDLSAVGMGCPDLLVARPGHGTILVEVKADAVNERKDGYKRTGRGALLDSQRRFIASWRGTVAVVRTEQEALEAVGITVRRVVPERREEQRREV